MVNSKLLNYIQTNQAKGYTIQQLREYLIRQGYNPAEVDEATRYAGRGVSSPMQPNLPAKNSHL